MPEENAPTCACGFGPGECLEPAVEGLSIFCMFCDDSPFHNHCIGCGAPVAGRPDPNARCETCGRASES